MKVRKILDGDYCFGHGRKEFLTDTPEAIAQNVTTRLALWSGTWFLDTENGTPWVQSILGKHEAVDTIIQARIASTEGVEEITEFETILDPDARSLTVTATISTIYGEASISEVLNGN